MRLIAVWVLLFATTPLSAQEGFAEALAARLGSPVQTERTVQGEVPRRSMLVSIEGWDQEPVPEPARAYRGQVVELAGVTVQRLTFRDPAMALEFAERHVEPPAVVEVRGKYVVAISGPAALTPGVAGAALGAAWRGEPARTPRALLGVAASSDESAFLTSRQGELWRQAENMLRKAEERFPAAPVGAPQRVSDTLRVTWTDAGHRALRAEGAVHASCDARGPLVRTVVARDAAGHERLAGLLDGLAQPAGAQERPQPQAAPRAADPASVGLNKVVELVDEALQDEITAPIR